MAQVTPIISWETALSFLLPLLNVFLIVYIIKLIIGIFKELK